MIKLFFLDILWWLWLAWNNWVVVRVGEAFISMIMGRCHGQGTYVYLQFKHSAIPSKIKYVDKIPCFCFLLSDYDRGGGGVLIHQNNNLSSWNSIKLNLFPFIKFNLLQNYYKYIIT